MKRNVIITGILLIAGYFTAAQSTVGLAVDKLEEFYNAFGEEFGKTVESLFADSFELPNLSSGINWSTGLLGEFKKQKGYDLTSYLPAIWWEVSDISPKIRFDVNDFLHQTGLNVFFKTFPGWCGTHHINGRIQPYGFNTDNIEASGMAHIPEMEITAGEKDAADWFDTRIGPKQYVASGAHLYGREVVSAEVYTFIHWERYRETLEELKIAGDGKIKIRNMEYKVLILPNVETIPLKTLQFIEKYVAGGGVVIALERLPENLPALMIPCNQTKQ